MSSFLLITYHLKRVRVWGSEVDLLMCWTRAGGGSVEAGVRSLAGGADLSTRVQRTSEEGEGAVDATTPETPAATGREYIQWDLKAIH